MTSLANLHKFLYCFEKTIRISLSMPNCKSISFEMTELWEGGEGRAESAPPHVCVIQKTPCGIGLIFGNCDLSYVTAISVKRVSYYSRFLKISAERSLPFSDSLTRL